MLNGKDELSLMSHEGYRQAWQRLQELRGQASELEAQAEKLRVKGRPGSVKSQRDRQVDAIVAGQEPEEVKRTEEWQTDLEEAQSRARLFSEAAKKQEKEVAKQRLIASKEICKKVGPRYQDIVRRMALTYIKLGEAIIAEKDLRESLNDNDIALGNIRPMVINGIGDPRDHTSRISQWLMEAIQYDFITISDLPRAWFKKLEPYLEAKKKAATSKVELKKAEPIREGWNS